jgi:hypothetical protein
MIVHYEALDPIYGDSPSTKELDGATSNRCIASSRVKFSEGLNVIRRGELS